MAVKTVGIKNLKNRLSAYLREVRHGTRILVSDRDVVVAEIHEPTAGYETGPADPIVRDWIRDRIVTPPSIAKAPLPASSVHLEEGIALRLLDRDRSDRAP